jgi:alkylhydroperoxidase/carboxymuconolactone decarboxylase family protein YurZ
MLPFAMIKLYGEEEAARVHARCYQVDPFFGHWVSEQIYGVLWELPPLSFYEKSLITVVALIVLEREEQLQIHFKGLLYLGKDIDFILQIIAFLLKNKFMTSADSAVKMLESATSQQHLLLKLDGQRTPELSPGEEALINLSALVVKAKQEDTTILIKDLLTQNKLSEEEVRAVMRHLMTYCGCPPVMSGLGILQEILTSSSK